VSNGDWIGVGALAVSIIVAVLGYLSHPSFVSSSRFEDLRREVDELRQERKELITANRALERSRAFWQERYEAEIEHRKRGVRDDE
jgi:hypothetical protein